VYAKARDFKGASMNQENAIEFAINAFKEGKLMGEA
jgi:hypothetical protein